MSAVLIVGCGYVGERVARAEQEAGATVIALVRSIESVARLAALGIAGIRADLDDPVSLAALPTADTILYYFAPPPAAGVSDMRIANFLAAITRPPRCIVLISTTGVYGDCRGEWVTEDRAPHPVADRARRRLDAEQRLRAWGQAHAVPVSILRVPGIYGPGRLPVKRLQAGEPVLREAESPWSNRVHVDDLVRACLAAARAGQASGVYNISDGHPSTMTDYFNRVADAVGLPRPPQITRTEARTVLSDGMRSYLAESKRLDNRRMREELGIEPRYPDLAQGLAACVAAREPGDAESGRCCRPVETR
jgi:nucleoside-diphosphate-sugar epimerase